MTAAATAGDRLAQRIRRRIATQGPLTVAAFMAIALHDPELGYYSRRQPIGAAGDFTTAPEISQIFGEVIGIWCALAWEAMGRPEPVVLAELGPGRGVLMVDLLRAAAALPEFLRALRLHLVEASPRLRAEQERRLTGTGARWLERVDQLPPGPLLLVANEFLDALPVRQLVRTAGGWAERLVALDTEGDLIFADGPESAVAALLVPAGLRESAVPGSVVEICSSALALAASLGRRLAESPGAALFVDYGHFPSRPGATLRAFRRHRAQAVTADPGCADLSTAVDFAAVAEAARAAGATVHGPVAQRRFLAALGAGARCARLCTGADPAQCQALESGLARLVDPSAMGETYKAMALTTPGVAPPPGFGAGVQR
jgi:NADH dehydrogenase [ubiquinone] 1 alpha subcomplex assembly factor 7